MAPCTCLLRYLLQLAYMLIMGLVDTSRFLVRCLRSRAALAAEILFLRKQLALYRERGIKPRRITHAIRLALVRLGYWFDWRPVLAVVQPATFLRWHRQGFRRFWRWTSLPGRPPIPPAATPAARVGPALQRRPPSHGFGTGDSAATLGITSSAANAPVYGGAFASARSGTYERLEERGATGEEVRATVEQGEPFPAKFGRTGLRRNFRFDQYRHGLHYHTKQVEAYTVQEGPDWLVTTVLTCYF